MPLANVKKATKGTASPRQSKKEDTTDRSKKAGGKKDTKESKRKSAEQERLAKVAQEVDEAQRKFEEMNPLTRKEIQARVEISPTAQKFGLGAGLTLRYGYMSQRGYYPDSPYKNNQDAFKVLPTFNGVAEHLVFGVFDGHGQDGDGVSYFVRDNLEAELKAQMAKHPADFETAYKQTFVALNTKVKRQSFDTDLSGTTAITAFFHGPEITVANLGDSRAIVGERGEGADRVMAYSLSIDQTPYRKDERDRCKAAGADVMTMDQLEGLEPIHENWGLNLGEETDDGGDPPRLWKPGYGYPGCAFTRSIGDDVAEEVGVFAIPEVLTKVLSATDVFVCLASDGVWEFLTNQTVTDIIMNFDDPCAACASVIAEAYRLWLQYDTRTDDITMILAFIEVDDSLYRVTEPSRVSRKGSTSGVTSGVSVVTAGGESRPVRRGLSREKKKQMAIAVAEEEPDISDEPDVPVEVIPKTDAERALIRAAVRSNFLFAHLNEEQSNQLFDVMVRVPVESGDVIIKQGATGDRFYVVDSGQYSVTIAMDGQEVEVLKYNSHECFGELALMYSKPRAATVTALSTGFLWAVDRRSFRSILMKSSATSIIKTLRSVDVLKSLSIGQLQRLEDLLTEVTVKEGTYIIRQGDTSEFLYVISDGRVRVTKSDGVTKEETTLMELASGAYFGERALLNAEPRAANVIAITPSVKLLHISKDAFEEVLGPLQEIIEKDHQVRERVADEMRLQQEAEGLVGVQVGDFEMLGVTHVDEPVHYVIAKRKGGQGGVYSIKAANKEMAKERGVAQRVLAEKELMAAMTCNHRMVPSPLAFLHDDRYLYSVYKMHAAVDLATLLHDGHTLFDEPTTRFYTASVALALEHLHLEAHRVIFRHVAPDGIMLDADGYVQLMDMRYAVKADSAPNDFCGFAHYLAPEQVAAQGHGLATDLWALGVLTYEMICHGHNPWLTGDSEQDSEVGVYSRISAHKVGSLAFPEDVSLSDTLKELLNMLIDPSPASRLGCADGPRELRDAEWFEDFAFAALEAGEMRAPHAQVAADALDAALKQKRPLP